MKLTIDTERRILQSDDGETVRVLDLYGSEAFAVLSQTWLKAAWVQKYSYTFSWLGRPVIQLPEDLMRVQEAIVKVRPDVIIETGVAHGGSLVFYASLCALSGSGRVIGIDVDIRSHNRAAIEQHPLSPYITLIEGSSTDPVVVDQVNALIAPNDRVMVLLDSNHTYDHVAAELRLYSTLVTPGSYLIVQDGIMRSLADVPGGQARWRHDNPVGAVADFAAQHAEFIVEPPAWIFNESNLKEGLTHWTSGWLHRRTLD